MRVKIDQELAGERDKLTLDGYYSTIEKVAGYGQKIQQQKEALKILVDKQIPQVSNHGKIERLEENLDGLKKELENTEKRIEKLKNARTIRVVLTVVAGGITAIISHNPVATIIAIIVAFVVLSLSLSA